MTQPLVRTRRVIVDSDAANEADDQFAIVHALLSPTLDVRGVIPAHFGTKRVQDSLDASRREVDLLLRLLGMEGRVRVENGAPAALVDPKQPQDSSGARLIVEEAHREAVGPLFVAFLGPLTDMASALLIDPTIQDRDITVVWIGGPPYDGIYNVCGPEFNLCNDIQAANVVFGSRLKVWQVPMSVYTMIGVGYAELRQRVAPCGELGAYLVDQVIAYNTTVNPEPAEHRSLGDSPAISVILNPRGAVWRERSAPAFARDGSLVEPTNPARRIRVCESVDSRYLLEDMFSKLKEFAQS